MEVSAACRFGLLVRWIGERLSMSGMCLSGRDFLFGSRARGAPESDRSETLCAFVRGEGGIMKGAVRPSGSGRRGPRAGTDSFRCLFRISFETDGLTGIFSSGLPACKETAACRYRLSLSFDRGRWRNGKLLMFIKKCNEQLFVMKRLLYLM